MTQRRSVAVAVLLVLTACGDDAADRMKALRTDEMVNVAPPGAELAEPTFDEGNNWGPAAEWMSVSRDVTFDGSAADVVRFYADELIERQWFEVSVRCTEEGGRTVKYFVKGVRASNGQPLEFWLIVYLDENGQSSAGNVGLTSPPDGLDVGLPIINEATPPDLECLGAA